MRKEQKKCRDERFYASDKACIRQQPDFSKKKERIFEDHFTLYSDCFVKSVLC